MRIKRYCARKIFRHDGFSLIEILVAVFVVGLSLTVFLQLFSGSLRLSYKSRYLLNETIRADAIFSYLLKQDIVHEDFSWSGEISDGSWDLHMNSLQTLDTLDENLKQVAFDLPAELYQLVFTLRSLDGRAVIVLTSTQTYSSGYFSEDFKKEHIDMMAPREEL